MSQVKEEHKDHIHFEESLTAILDDGVEERNVRALNEDEIWMDGQVFRLVENKNQALDLDQLDQRYSDLFEKFDYIVGDLGFDQLRLRGFYEDDTPGVPLDMRISTLEDYLFEYCNFGCDYFVLQRVSEKAVFPDYKKKTRPQKKGGRKAKGSQGHAKASKKKQKMDKRHKTKKTFQKTKSEPAKAMIKEQAQVKEENLQVEHKKASFKIKKKK